MDQPITRPRLVTFRCLEINCQNTVTANSKGQWSLKTTQEIDIGLAAPAAQDMPLQALVKIKLTARAECEGLLAQSASFNAEYEGKFDYQLGVGEVALLPLFDEENYQYGLVAQVFPLAMTHFRREMQSMGFDARQLPLGI